MPLYCKRLIKLFSFFQLVHSLLPCGKFSVICISVVVGFSLLLWKCVRLNPCISDTWLALHSAHRLLYCPGITSSSAGADMPQVVWMFVYQCIHRQDSHFTLPGGCSFLHFGHSCSCCTFLGGRENRPRWRQILIIFFWGKGGCCGLNYQAMFNSMFKQGKSLTWHDWQVGA